VCDGSCAGTCNGVAEFPYVSGEKRRSERVRGRGAVEEGLEDAEGWVGSWGAAKIGIDIYERGAAYYL